jgi:hypothetical protein
MPFQLKTVNKPTDAPSIAVYANFREFQDKAPRDSKYLTHGGVLMQKKRINKDNFRDVAVEVAEGSAPAADIPRAETLIQEAIKNDTKAGAVAVKQPSEPVKVSQPEKLVPTSPPLDLGALGKVLSEAIASSMAGSNAKAAEAWSSALKSAVEESNTRLQTTLEGLSLTYMELGGKVAEALNSGVLDQVADKRFQDIQKTLEALNEKALAEIRKDKSGIEEIRNEIDKKLGNLGHLASDIQEDSTDVMRRVEKFKLGTAEMLQQQVTQLQKQLADVHDENTKLSRELLEIRCNLGEANPEYVHDLEKRVASLSALKSEILEKDLQLQQHEGELSSLRALSKAKLRDFHDHQRLEELESLAQGYEREKEEWQSQLDETSRELTRTKKRLLEANENVRLLRESAMSTQDLELSLRDARQLEQTRARELYDTQHARDLLANQLADCELALAQGEQHYRETLLAADRKALQEDFRIREKRFDDELSRLQDALEREIERNQWLEEQREVLQAKAEKIAADKLEIQGQVEAGLPQAYQRALAEIKHLREDELRLAALSADCAHHQQLEKNLQDNIAALREDEGRVQEQVASLRKVVGELTAEQEKLDALKKKIENDRFKIEADLETDPIAGTFKVKADETEKGWLNGIRKGIREEGFEISDRLLYAFHTALKCQDISPLTLLMGISGTGKSELPRLYSAFGGIHFHLAAVQPNWDSPSDLFGFYNYAEARPKLEPLSRHLLQFLPTVKSTGETRPKRGDELLLVLLDEMNLARVEYYFSDLLSRLEARRSLLGKLVDKDSHLRASISLDMGASESRHLFLDSNVMFVGTLNQDESTLEVSDKVVDRANAITFPRPKSFCPISTKKATTAETLNWRLSRQLWDEWCRGSNHGSHDADELQSKFQKINGALKHVERGVAHRVFQAVQRYVESYPVFAADNPQKAAEMALVDQFAMKILPKLKGVPTDTQDGKACLAGIENVLPEDLREDFNHARRGDFFDWQGCEKLFETGS